MAARRVVAEHDGRCARGGHRCQVLGIRDEREIAGAGVFDAGDAHDLNLAVAFEAAGETFRKFPQFHRGIRGSISDGLPQ